MDHGTLLQIKNDQQKSILIDQRVNLFSLKEKISQEFETCISHGINPLLTYK